MCGLLIELCLISLSAAGTSSDGMPARYFLFSSTLVLAILLSETALLYARLARSVWRRAANARRD